MKFGFAIGLMLLFYFPSQAQEITITGIILDYDTCQPIQGAQVTEKGVMNITISDFKGNYQIRVGPEAILIVSAPGYETKKIPVSSRKKIDILLTPCPPTKG